MVRFPEPSIVVEPPALDLRKSAVEIDANTGSS
jgi:hypothetical protein